MSLLSEVLDDSILEADCLCLVFPMASDSDELRYLLDSRVEYQPLFGKGARTPRPGEACRPDSRKRR